jgi:hypothetical protein
MQILSQEVEIHATTNQVLEFISISSNIEKLLPQDKISDFKFDENSCSFKVQGGIIISLIQSGRDENKLYLTSGEKSPFPFKLTIHTFTTNKGCKGFIEFNGEVNAFLKMLVEKPLSALFNYMTNQMKEQFLNY